MIGSRDRLTPSVSFSRAALLAAFGQRRPTRDIALHAEALYVPTDVVQTFYDFLVLGPELYAEVMTRGPS